MTKQKKQPNFLPYKTVKRSEIKLADYNPRYITDDNKKNLEKSINLYGNGGLIYNELSRTLVSGHQRLSVADKEMKYDENNPDTDYDVPVQVVNLDFKKEIECNVAHNNPNTQGQYAPYLLADVIKNNTDLNLDLSNMFFNAYDIASYNLTQTVSEIVVNHDDTDDINSKVMNDINKQYAHKDPVKYTPKELTEEEKKKAQEYKKTYNDTARNATSGHNYFIVIFPTMDDKNEFVADHNLKLNNDEFISADDLIEAMDNYMMKVD